MICEGTACCLYKSLCSSDVTLPQAFSDGRAESEVAIYCSPADREDELYEQLKTHSIKNIPPTEIE